MSSESSTLMDLFKLRRKENLNQRWCFNLAWMLEACSSLVSKEWLSAIAIANTVLVGVDTTTPIPAVGVE